MSPAIEGVDWDGAAKDYAAHRAPFPALIAQLLQPLGIGRPGEALVDLATGVGTPGLQFASAGAVVTGVDVSSAMLEQARLAADREGLELRTVVASAEDTGLPGGMAASVTVGQAWHWFDGPVAAQEVHRLLRPGGRVAVCNFDWIATEPGLALTTDVLRRHNPDLVAKRPLEALDRRPEWIDALESAGLVVVANLDLVVDEIYTRDAWRGRLRASTWVEASLAPNAVSAVDEELADVLRRLPEPLVVPHNLRIVVAEKRA